MKYSRKKVLAVVIALLVAVAAGTVAWQLMPSSATAMRQCAVVVEQATWQEISIDGKPRLYFSEALGDTALLGVTANRDTAVHRRRMAGCWVNRWAMLPSCMGRVATVYCPAAAAPRLRNDSDIVRLCRKSIETQLRTLKSQKTELDYYLRVHGVQDNGYQTIASLASRVNAVYSDVQSASHMLDSLAKGKHRFTVKAMAEYTAVYRDADGKPQRTPLRLAHADPALQTMLLQTADGKTPSGATAMSHSPWNAGKERYIRAVGFPGLGEAGLECDTVAPIIVPGHIAKGSCHDLPAVLVSDGSPVFTAKGHFLGIVKGNKIVNCKTRIEK